MAMVMTLYPRSPRVRSRMRFQSFPLPLRNRGCSICYQPPPDNCKPREHICFSLHPSWFPLSPCKFNFQTSPAVKQIDPSKPAEAAPTGSVNHASNRGKTLGGPASHKQVRHKRNHGEKQQQMNQPTRHMEHQKAAGPQNDQQQRNHEEGSKSHFRLLNAP
jgi:hypothetical protein